MVDGKVADGRSTSKIKKEVAGEVGMCKGKRLCLYWERFSRDTWESLAVLENASCWRRLARFSLSFPSTRAGA